jgi:O-antigen/teichoic acid export membrane protein
MKDREGRVPGLARTVVSGAGLAVSGLGLSQGLNFLFYVVLARLATPQDFGQFAAATVLTGLGTLLTETGMQAALIHRRDRLEEAASTAVVATVLGGICLSLVALALAPAIGWFFDSAKVAEVAAVMSGWLVLVSACVVPEALMQRRFSFRRRLVVEPCAVLVFGAVAVTACASGMGVWGLVLGTYASALTRLVLSWTLGRWRPRRRLVSFAMWRELAGYGRHVLASEFVRRSQEEVPTLLIGGSISSAALGQYRYAARVAIQPLGVLINAGAYVLLPAFARIADEEARFRAAFLRGLRWMCVIAFPTSLVLFPLGLPIMVLCFGERWRDAGLALTALCGLAAGGALVSISSEAFKALGRPQILTRMHLFSGALLVLFALALLPLGLVGVATAISLASLGTAAWAIHTVGRLARIPLRRMLREIWPPAVAALAMAAALYPLERLTIAADRRPTLEGLALLACELALAAVVFLAVLAVLAPQTLRELRGGVAAAQQRARARPSTAPGAASPDEGVTSR